MIKAKMFWVVALHNLKSQATIPMFPYPPPKGHFVTSQSLNFRMVLKGKWDYDLPAETFRSFWKATSKTAKL